MRKSLRSPGPEILGWSVVLLITAALRLLALSREGWGSPYLAATVWSMSGDLHRGFFAAFDPGGFVTVDKPPLGLWPQALAVRLLGFTTIARHLPQALAGIATVVLLGGLVRRSFGVAAGLLAALFLAITPIAVVADRSNHPDAWLGFYFLLAAWALSCAETRPEWRYPLLAGVALGAAFLVKMLAALVPVPAFAAALWLGAPGPVLRRSARLGLFLVALFLTAWSWPLAVDRTPPERRPFVGGSQDNSVRDLVLGYNGLRRVAGGEGQMERTEPGSVWSIMMGGVPGPTRLFQPGMGDQWSWFLPLAPLGFVVALRRRRAAAILWGGWSLAYGVVFSIARGTLHTYYLSALAPAAAALAGIGGAWLAGSFTQGDSRRFALPAFLLLTTLWSAGQVMAAAPEQGWLSALLGGGGAWLAGGMVVRAIPGEQRGASLLAGLALLAALAAPLYWNLETLRTRSSGFLPFAGPLRRRPQPILWLEQPLPARLIGFLSARRQGARFLAAVPSVMQAAPLILQTGQPVMTMGGFLGMDPILTPERFAASVHNGAVRFALIPQEDSPYFGGPAAVHVWIRRHGALVGPDRWRGGADDTEIVAHLDLYQLRR